MENYIYNGKFAGNYLLLVEQSVERQLLFKTYGLTIFGVFLKKLNGFLELN